MISAKTRTTDSYNIKTQLSPMNRLIRNVRRDKFLLLLILPVIAYYIIFNYVPMYGMIIAFKDFSSAKGILGSPWAEPVTKYFTQFFKSMYFYRNMKNTVLIGIYSLVWSFPVPIVFALILNEYRNGIFKRVTQTLSYLPHFISTVVVVGMMINFLSPSNGIVNQIITSLGFEPVNFLVKKEWFRILYIGSGIWQDFGWSSILFLAAIAGIEQEIYESARIDGANRWKQMLHVTLPGIVPTIIIVLILNLGSLLNMDYQKIILMYNEANRDVSDVLLTYVYRAGILQSEYSYGAAVGMFNSVLNMIFLIVSNQVIKKKTEISLW